MGIDYIDFWSIGHLLGGVATRISICPHDPFYSYTLGITLHLIIELNEKSKINNKLTESIENHIGDILIFLLGMMIGEFINNYIPNKIRPFILVILMICSYFEIYREF